MSFRVPVSSGYDTRTGNGPGSRTPSNPLCFGERFHTDPIAFIPDTVLRQGHD